jgi:hypothetical protein
MSQRTFLDDEELRVLTGRARKAWQIAALRTMGVPFLINACGKPVVTRIAIEGRQTVLPPVAQAWTPAVLNRAA